MKADARRWADEVPIKSGPKVVLQALADHVSKRTGRCFPSVGTLVRKTALAESTVRANLRVLEAHGLITTTERRKDGKQTSSDYSLHVGAKPKPIGKRPDALRKAQQHASQTPKSGGWEEVSSHRNMAAVQTPDFGPEYYTPRGGEEGEDSIGQPGMGLEGDEHSNIPIRATPEEGLDSGAMADAVPSKQGEGAIITPWLEDGEALSGVEALSVARTGEQLTLETVLPPTEAPDQPTWPDAEVVVFPGSEMCPWSVPDWCANFEERAGIAEYEGGLSRAEAEAVAFEGCVSEWQDQHPVRSLPDCCVHCTGSGRPGDPLVSAGGSPAWMHHNCQESWRTDLRDAAVAALRAMGIAGCAPVEVIPLAKRRARA